MNDCVVDFGTPSPQFREWVTTEVRFHGFADLPNVTGQKFKSPEFTCLSRKWCLTVYPGGDDRQRDMVSIFLKNLSGGTVKPIFFLLVKSSSGNGLMINNSPSLEYNNFPSTFISAGRRFLRSMMLDSLIDGTLIVEVRMKLNIDDSAEKNPPTVFIPENPFCQIMLKSFMDKKTADVIFEVGGASQEANDNAAKEAKTTPTTFYTHRLILQKCTTTLAEICDSGGDNYSSPIQITDVSPDIFHHLLHYIYGGKVDDKDLKSHSKEIIEAADKYGVPSLKLEAEACLVSTTTIDVDNVMEYLSYADAKNCALLKEVVMDFIVQNKVEVLETISFRDAPTGPTMITDILAAMARIDNERENIKDGQDQFSTMRISDLRRRVHKKGLDVDGSRETLIASLKNSS